MRQYDERIAFELRAAYRAMARAFESETKRYGVDMAAWMFLRALRQQDGLTQKELIDQAGLMQPATSAALKQLAERGLVRRRIDVADRRCVRIHLTVKARALLDRLAPIAAKTRRQAVSDFSRAEVGQLLAMLARVQANVGTTSPLQRPRGAPKSRARRVTARRAV